MEKQQKLSAPELAAMAAAIEQFDHHDDRIEAIYCTDAANCAEDVKAADFDKNSASDYTKIVKSNE